MAADADAIAIANAHVHDFVDRCLRVRNQLLDVRVVCRFTRADDRHCGIVKDRITGHKQEEMRITANGGEAIW